MTATSMTQHAHPAPRSTSRRRTSASTWTAKVLVLTVVSWVLIVGGGGPAPGAVVDARCNHSKSDASVLQKAIDTSHAGSEIVFHGPCLLTSTLVLAGGRSYRGDSPSTAISGAPNSNLPALLASDSWADDSTSTGLPISLTNLTLNARANKNPSSGPALIIRSWDSTLSGLRIMNANTDGLLLTNLSHDGTALSTTQVNGTIQNVFVSNSGQSGIHVQDTGNSVTDWNLLDNWVADSGSDAIRIKNGAGWTIERNHIYGVGGAGINVDRLYATSLSDNYIEDFQTSGITATVQGDAASTISGNRIFNFHGAGTDYLAVTEVNYGHGDLAVTGNMIRGSGSGVGLSYQGGDHSLTVLSSGNLVTDVTRPRVVGNNVQLTTGY